MDNTKQFIPPTLAEIQSAWQCISPYVIQTPTHQWSGDFIQTNFSDKASCYLKLELFQRTGTFKARGAVNNVLALTDEQKAKGITAVSAGNHAIAASYAAKCLGIDAKVVMQASANPARVAAAKALGAEVLIAEDGLTAFAKADEIVEKEGRAFIHPFEGQRITEASASCGVELHEAVKDLDAVVVPVGAGGLCSGIGTATKLLRPDCKVYAVEPIGAPVMSQSLAAGEALTIQNPGTIADSLAPPMTTPYCFSMCQQSIDEIVLVSDEQLAAAVALLFEHLKFAVEPAAATSTAAALGPLKEKLAGKKFALIICGSNIDADTHHKLLLQGYAALDEGVF